MKKILYLLCSVFLFETLLFADVTPRADWRMDECYWEGTSGEVKDSGGNGYDGTAHEVTTVDAKLCKGGDLRQNSTVDWIKLDGRALNGLDDFTIALWIRTSNTGGQALVSGAKDNTFNGANEALLYLVNSRRVRPHIKNSSVDLSIPDIADGQWHHIVWTRKGKQNCIYIDGGNRVCGNINRTGPVAIDRNGLYLGQEQDSLGGGFDANQDFEGVMDELKIYDLTLNRRQIRQIYDNEKEGKNFDGTPRECPCRFDLVTEYRMDECTWTGVSGDVTDSSGNGFDLTSREDAISEKEGRLCRRGEFFGSGKVQGEWQYTFQNEVTLAAWIKTTKIQASYARIVEFSSHGGHYRYGTALAYDGAGKVLRGWTANASGTRSLEVSYDLQSNGFHDGKWHHVAYVYGGGKARLYLDGALVDEASTDIGDVEDPTTLVIGGYYPSDNYGFRGSIDEVKIFFNALSDTQIRMIYRNESAGKNFNSTLRHCMCAMPRAEWRMDECMWARSTGEVRDSSGNGYDATAHDATTTKAKLCMGGDFRADGTRDYVELPHEAMDGLEDFSVAVWIRTSNRGGQSILSGAKSGRANEALMWLNNSTTFMPFIHNKSKKITIPDIADNEWHHLVWTRKGGENCIYMDGNKVGMCVDLPTGSVSIAEGGLIVAQEQDSVGGDFDPDQDFEGVMDELEIYDSALDETQIKRIYNNEKSLKNSDGTRRGCLCCAARFYSGPLTPLQFEGAEITLLNTLDHPQWTHIAFNQPFDEPPIVFILPDTRGDHPATTRIRNVTQEGFDAIMAEPQGEDGPHYDQTVNYLAINRGIHKIGNTIFEVGDLSTTRYQQASQGENVHSEWETAPTIFEECSPAVVAQIQTIANEKGIDKEEEDAIVRSRPWMTVAIDTNGTDVLLALDRSETNEEMIANSERIGYMIAEANVRDSFVDDQEKEIRFETIKKERYFEGWEQDCRSVSFRQSYDKTPLIAAGKNSRYEADGGWLRRCFLDTTGIGVLIDEDGSTYSQTKYDYKEPPQDRERSHRPEDVSIFVFSEAFSVRESETPNAFFDAWDSFRDLHDRNISTKIVGAPFELTLAALNDDGSDYADFNGTVCVRLERKSDERPFTSWQRKIFSEDNRTTIGFTPTVATKEAVVRIVWKRGVEEECPLADETNATPSTDTFAVRPDRFIFLQPAVDANLTAEHEYRFDSGVVAVAADSSTPAGEYNTTVALQTKKYMRTGDRNDSLAGSVQASFSSFADGVADLNLSFNDVAIVSLELNDTQWAAVDIDDTPETNRTVYGERNLTFIPHHFKVVFSSAPIMEDNDTSQHFTYLSDDLAMSGWLRGLTIEITAQGENGGTMRNFSNPMNRLYADPIDIMPILNLPDKHSPARTLGEPQPKNGVDLGFVEGNAVLTYSDVAFNYDRRYDHPIDPFIVAGSESNISVTVTDATYPSVTGGVLSHFGGGAHFYFGRLRAENIRTNQPHVENVAELEVYDAHGSAMVGGFRQNSLHWYRNEKHTGGMSGGIEDARATEDITLSSAPDTGLLIDFGRYGNGTITMDINTTTHVPRKRIVHLDVNSWLWYVPEGFGGDYSYDASSDCTRHPCFEYTFAVPGAGRGVESGEINGSDFDAGALDANTTYQRKQGVKLFR